MKSINDINHIFYINLANRPDRKEHVEKQLLKIGLKAERFNAIKLENGALGCSISHLKCLEIAKKNNWPHIMIIEDDIEFLKPQILICQLNKLLIKNDGWDVILIGGNNVGPYTKIDDTCVKVSSCQTTTGYIVNGHYFNTLIENIRAGINNLLKFPHLHMLYAIDKHWFNLQKKDNWYLVIPLTVTQREDYSDIQKRITNYTKPMIDLNKEHIKVNTNKFSKGSTIINNSLLNLSGKNQFFY
jgi:glycosyl transferase family 25